VPVKTSGLRFLARAEVEGHLVGPWRFREGRRAGRGLGFHKKLTRLAIPKVGETW
jgi:hypothetical protein